MSSLEAVELVDRIWARDPTVWTGRDEAHWLGWLDEPGRMLERPEMHEIADRLETEIPNTRRAVIEGTAHVPSMERPPEFDELVLGFLAEAQPA